jgi:hypothetical protein
VTQGIEYGERNRDGERNKDAIRQQRTASRFHSPSNEVEHLTGFDHVPGRSEWIAHGPPLHVRSVTATANGGAILAAVHVGGIPRSTDGGVNWAPTIPIEFDVHEVPPRGPREAGEDRGRLDAIRARPPLIHVRMLGHPIKQRPFCDDLAAGAGFISGLVENSSGVTNSRVETTGGRSRRCSLLGETSRLLQRSSCDCDTA